MHALTMQRPQHAPLNGAGPGSGNIREDLTSREHRRVGVDTVSALMQSWHKQRLTELQGRSTAIAKARELLANGYGTSGIAHETGLPGWFIDTYL